MPVQFAELYANHADLVVLGGIAAFAAVGIYLAFQRILSSVQRLRSPKIDAYLGEIIADAEEDSW